MIRENNIGKPFLFTVCLVVMAFSTFGIASAATLYVNPGESIQTAVTVANSSDTIIVRDGMYTENIDVNKILTIQSENGFENCIVQTANSNDHVFSISSSHVTISGFTVVNATGNDKAGIYLSNVEHCTITGNNVTENYYGIACMGAISHHNNFTNNTVSYNFQHGILLDSSLYNTLAYNAVFNNTGSSGIRLGESHHNEIVHNNFTANSGEGMEIDRSENNSILHNSVSCNSQGGGVVLYAASNNNLVQANIFFDNEHYGINVNGGPSGIVYERCENITIKDNTVYGTDGIGLGLNNLTDSWIENNTVFNNMDGIIVQVSQNNTIIGNNASSNGDTGIKLDYSSYNNLSNCTVSTNGRFGIWLRRSPYNTLRGNSMEHNGFLNLAGAESLTLEEFNNDVDTSNTVNGYPVYRFYMVNDTVIDGLETRKLYAIGCNNITIRNIHYSDGDSLALLYTHNSLIENCSVTNNIGIGFELHRSHYNQLINNKAINTNVGIVLQAATHNKLTKNIIKGNTGNGVSLDPSTSNNLLYHNRFIANTNQASDNGTGNTWDNGYPSGGNYWSDFNGTDNYRGPGQSIPGRDGIGDTPYSISGAAGAQDRYPLLHPVAFFDTGFGMYPSISGMHNGTITPARDLSVSTLYTYACAGTGGHTEYIKIWDDRGWNVTATWNGYTGDWRNLTFAEPFILSTGTTYNYTIRTGSYPQIIHARELNATGGTITCTEFVDRNGRKHEGGIPAIRLGMEELRVGIVVPLTGGMSTTGTDMWRGAVLAAEELNAMGGVNVNGVPMQLILVKGDDESSRDGGIRAVTKLITEDKVDILVGGFSSGITYADSVVAVDHHVPFIITGASSPAITRRTDIDTSYLFHHSPTTDDFPNSTLLFVDEIVKPAIYARFNFSAGRPLRLAVLYQNSSYGQGVYDGINKTIALYNLNMDVVAAEKFEMGATNYTSALTALKAAGPDVIYPAAVVNEQPLIVIQGRRDVGLNSTYLSVEVNDDPSYYTGVGSWGEYSIQESRFSPYAIPPGPIHTAVMNFKEEYETRWGTAPGMISASTYEGVYIAAEAIEHAGTVDKAAVRDALAELEMPQLVELMKGGVVTFSPDYRESKFELYMQQLLWDESGNETRPKIVWPASVKETDFVLPAWYEPGSP